ncbi:SusC/RagA family TonB-linked outer membrane protein [Solitalea longa]|uniref:SusC/RagA family TonB-linked outer membrane protein n=1 Tax=Solitalea longa TaxID=2079460 RepID=A0A2S5A729_9SPHI|nr:SusC/RagA family TonB-linked outer membrane protein [Solitalea longa]POY37913.1 SusC/RagA family TonB-linked outer membrane protein [Solitalea longa]
MYQKITIKRGKASRLSHKIWLIMRLTTVILIATMMQVSAISMAQKITLAKIDAPLKEVITELRKQSGYDFIVPGSVFNLAKPVTVNITNVDFEDALKKIFDNQPVDYNIESGNVTLKIKEPNLIDELIVRIKEIDVNGKVVDEKGLPLPGATVKVKGMSLFTNTDMNGSFSLKSVPEDATIVISFLGFKTSEIKAQALAARKDAVITLIYSESKLDEVQVIAYGTTSRRLSTSNIATVKAEEIAKSPVSNPLLALQGRVPGLIVTQNTGFSGGGVKVRVQGQNSQIRGSDPLYVIDGVPYTSQLVNGLQPTLGSSTPNPVDINLYGGGNPLSFINPGDIESIDVLKDADATSIYGSRAANGAILITTKKGKAGQTRVEVNLQSGVGVVPKRMNLLNTKQYLQMRNEALKNDGLPGPGFFDFDLNGAWDQNRETDWQKELLGGTANYNDFQTSVTGGNANINYRAGAGYHSETTVFPTDDNDRKTSLHFNLNNISTNQKFKIQLNGSYMYDQNQIPMVDLTGMAMRLAPNAPALRNADGSLNWQQANIFGMVMPTWENPLSFDENIYRVKTTNLVSNAVLSYKLLRNLELKSSFGFTNLNADEFSSGRLSALSPEAQKTSTPSATYGKSNIQGWIIEPQLNYQALIGAGKLEAMLGSTLENRHTTGDRISGEGYASDLVLEDVHAAAKLNNYFPSVSATYKYNALFGRLNYNFRDKYLVNASIRRDGSSRFGPENQFNNFYSIAGAWVFSNEEFIKKNASFLSFGKLRASYGTTGNDQIGDYQFMDLYNTPFGINPYLGVNPLVPSQLYNPLLQWEETKKLNFGIDMGFFKDRVLLNANYSRNRSSNQLGNYGLPVSTGFNVVVRNIDATVQNTAWELSLTTMNLMGNGFNWSTSLNLTVPKNELIAYPNIDKSSAAGNLLIGSSLSQQLVLGFRGVDPTTGAYVFADKDGNTVPLPNAGTDRVLPFNTDPKFYGGLQNTFSYKGFQLDALFQFVKQTGRNTNILGDRPGAFSGNTGNQPADVLNAWHKQGDVSNIQRYSQNFSLFFQNYYAANFSDVVFTDASYIRLENVSLSWSIPQSWRNKWHMQNLRFFTQGQNLLTFTKYKGLDPETQSQFSLPPLRVLTFGVRAVL